MLLSMVRVMVLPRATRSFVLRMMLAGSGRAAAAVLCAFLLFGRILTLALAALAAMTSVTSARLLTQCLFLCLAFLPRTPWGGIRRI